MSAVEELRRATRALHDRLDRLPYARRVIDGTVRLEDYAAFLASLAVIHEAVAVLAAEHPDAQIQGLWQPESNALPALRRDLEHLAAMGVEAVVPRAAPELASVLGQLSKKDPRTLAGVFYVLEGSKLGGVVQAAALAEIPALGERGREYLGGSGASARPRSTFRQFLARLEAALASDPAPAIRGAVAAFEGFEAIVSAVSSGGESPRFPA